MFKNHSVGTSGICKCPGIEARRAVCATNSHGNKRFLSIRHAQPQLNVVPGGIQRGNFVWDVGITPDLNLAGGSTPIAVEMGFRLTGAPLLSTTNINPAEFTTPNPGVVIFGWETLTDLGNGNYRPVGLLTNTTVGEIFVAYGTVNFATPGLKPFLRIVAQGPGNGGPSRSSAIERLGANGGSGRIPQLTSGGSTQTFFICRHGDASVPEPAGSFLLVLASVMFFMPRRGATRSWEFDRSDQRRLVGSIRAFASSRRISSVARRFQLLAGDCSSWSTVGTVSARRRRATSCCPSCHWVIANSNC